jgi:ABC-type glycerol-3-phosphate transport system permease component
VQEQATLTSVRRPIGVEVPICWKRQSIQRAAWLAVVYVVVLAGCALMLVPLYWLVRTALTPFDDFYLYPPKWIPNPIEWERIRYVLDVPEELPDWAVRSQFFSYLKNTLIVACTSVAGGVTSSALVAYALARMRFRGRNLLFYTVCGAMMLPSIGTLIPLFLTYKSLGWLNTFLPLVAPYFFGHAYSTFFLRQFLLTLPPELEDAARVDGCGTLRIWYEIIMPLSKPALTTVAIWIFVTHWNDLWLPLIYLQKRNLWTLQVGATVMFSGPGISSAYSSAVVLPLLALFFFAQKRLIKGIVLTGLRR